MGAEARDLVVLDMPIPILTYVEERKSVLF
jgi:hypothetical protein